MYAGVDEAGRGPVLGPLVVVGVLADPDHLPAGIDDSKAIPAGKRRALAKRLEADAAITVARRVVTAPEINDAMSQGRTLDEIEHAAFHHVLEVLDPEDAVVDTVGQDADAFGTRLTDGLEGCQVTARARADEDDPVVGAASILAKVERDARIEALAREVDAEIGSGYPSDPNTRAFLVAWRKEHRDPPPFARTAWSTLEKLGFGNQTLTDFTSGGST